MTAGANDLTTLDAVKQYLRLNTDTADGLLQTLITGTSAFIETYTNRIFKSDDYVERRDGIGIFARRMMFSYYPVTAVSLVKVTGIEISAASTVNSAGYLFDATSIVLNGYSFLPGFLNVELRYTAGYAQTPYDISQACNELVGLRYRELERIGQVSQSVNGENVTFAKDAMPADVRITLDQYKKVVTV